MSTPLRSLFAALIVAFVTAACAGGGTSSSNVPNVLGAPKAPAAETRTSSGERRGGDNDEHGKPTPAPAYTLFGDATLVHPGNNSNTAAQASWAAAPPSAAFGGIDFAVPAGMTFANLSNLSTDYKFTVGTCGQGSPRFSVGITNGTVSGNVNFYLGPPPNYTGCPPNVYANSGNLAAPANLVDDSQLPAGTFYDPYAAAQTKYGSYTVVSIDLIVDGFVATQPITAQFDNVRVNLKTYTFEPADNDRGGHHGDDRDGGHHGDE